MKTLIFNARLAGQAQPDTWVAITDETIAAIGHGRAPWDTYDDIVDASGALLMPGVIDCHVHFREPGLTHKADIRTESRAVLAGGVTSYMEMPNTIPQTTTIEAWKQKCEIAKKDSWANYAFFIGATSDNLAELKAADYSAIPGIKLFMGSSTGNMLVDRQDALDQIFALGAPLIAVHAEDQQIISQNADKAKKEFPEGVPMRMHSTIRSAQACIACTQRAADLAKKHNQRLHICHITTTQELDALGPLMSAEASPHHLMWCDEDYGAKGARIKMNPAVKTAADRDALRKAVLDGRIAMIATDHAPHLWDDKQGDALTAASGAPIAQFSLPLMLGLFGEEVAQRAMCQNPASIYGIDRRGRIEPGFYADLVLVDETEPYAISDDMSLSKCGWTPAAGETVRHKVRSVWVNGQLSYDQGRFSEKPNSLPLKFTLSRK